MGLFGSGSNPEQIKTLKEEIDQNQVAGNRTPTHLRKNSDNNGALKKFSNPATPNRKVNFNDAANDSARSDRTVDTVGFQKRMDMATEIEELQNKLQMSEMQNKHLQNQLSQASPARDMWQDDSVRRMQLLERENGRLHEQLDDSIMRVEVSMY